MKDVFEKFQKFQWTMNHIYYESEQNIKSINLVYEGKRVYVDGLKRSLLLTPDGDTIFVEWAPIPHERERYRIPFNIDDWSSLVKTAEKLASKKKENNPVHRLPQIAYPQHK